LGLTLLEYIMVAIEAFAFIYYDFTVNFNISLLSTLALPYMANLIHLVAYLLIFRKTEDFKLSL
jgi:hypothetical protein